MSPGLLEGGKTIGVQGFRPEIAVISCRIALAGKNVREMRRGVSRDNFRRPAMF